MMRYRRQQCLFLQRHSRSILPSLRSLLRTRTLSGDSQNGQRGHRYANRKCVGPRLTLHPS